MSPRRWWPAARQPSTAGHRGADRTGPATAGPVTGPADSPAGPDAARGPVLTLPESGRRIATEILQAADGGRTGVLHLVGDPGGLVYLVDGQVLHVETWTTPGVEILLLRRALTPARWQELIGAIGTRPGREAAVAQVQELLRGGAVTPIEVDVAQQRAVADAACALLGSEPSTLVRSRFFRGEQPWIGLSGPVPVTGLLAEAARRRRVLTRIGPQVGPDSPLSRAPRLVRPAVRVSGAQWGLIALADGRHSVRELAWLTGRDVFATVVETARLIRLGLLLVRPAAPAPAGPDGPLTLGAGAVPDLTHRPALLAGTGGSDG